MTIPDPVFTVVAAMFEEFAQDLEKSALRIRRNAEILRAAETPPDNTRHSLKVVPDNEEDWPQL